MRTVLRYVKENIGLWRAWLPLLLLAVVMPFFGLALPLAEKRLIDEVMLPRRLELLPAALVAYLAFWLALNLGQVVSSPVGTYLTEQLTLRLRRRLFVHSEALSLAFSQREHSGQTVALFTSDVPSMVGLFSSTVLSGLGSLVAVAVGIAIMLRMNWQLAIVGGLLPPLVAGLMNRFARPLRRMARGVQEKTAELTEGLHENLSGLREVIAFGQGPSQALRFTTTLDELLRLRMRVTLAETAILTGRSLFALAITLAIFGYGGYLVIRGAATLGTLIAMRSLFSIVIQPAGLLFSLWISAQKSLAAADRVYAFLDEKPRVQESEQAHAPPTFRGSIRFEEVDFAYQRERPVLSNVSFTAQTGEVIALVGPSGAGKSTLASLIARFYDPSSGRILVDGTDVRDFTLAGLRRQIGFVFQDTFLFASTVRENIAFGREGAHEAEIVAAAQAANAWEFIQRLPDGLDTPVGERGVQLSEGQRQRLAIARAFLRDPRILILDEPTSALDARSEHLLQTALEQLMRGRTTFVIAHRLATVMKADHILVIDGGRIVEEGRHEELLRRPGLYRELFELQFGVPVPVNEGRVSEECLLVPSA